MEKKVYNFIKDNNISISKPIVVAVSGGADSVALINILHNLNYDVIMAHVNHHMRVESEVEEKEMKSFAKRLNVKIEEVLRYLQYFLRPFSSNVYPERKST